ncbi:efflux RND transporter periplasmic adaptor subunit [Thalassotalea sp. 1_MG-2023]|uniref:efflux RND transporter periplasmic adaptor subunit n=1 Tax=Thalassotalea sp. 1_MG-2023 TaxID=3062680 RepID=UPI0026E3AE44|nr:efflux RND transporter periplasmic adaptor subunit [Thalassotalea sp. 1_MG-2023]MDO6425875.1 efflux RND transporter periplasmic adaptor subunit [Thalassotalea sp. 1_MG-2023]
MNIKQFILLVSVYLTFTIASMSSVRASGDHGHEEESTPTGMHGGQLLVHDNISVEVSFYEIGVAPEMRVYVYQDDQPISPKEVSLEVVLSRLNGQQDTLDFVDEYDYLVSKQSIVQPHSFDVTVKANIAGKPYQWQFEKHEGRTKISQRAIEASNIQTQLAQAGTLEFKETLFGVIAPTVDRQYSIMSPYAGVVESVLVTIGDSVKKGQAVLKVKNNKTLQSFTLYSPAEGMVTAQKVSQGERADQQALIEITDFSKVWVELSAFPENIEKMAIGQQANIYDLHHHLEAKGKVFYVAPKMTGGHIARARVLIDNPDGHWRPGMHVKADIVTGKKAVSMRVEKQAIQQLMNKPVVFARFGNIFEARPLILGEADDQWVEVLSGLANDTEYVTTNSYVLKADVLKAGASHAH